MDMQQQKPGSHEFDHMLMQDDAGCSPTGPRWERQSPDIAQLLPSQYTRRAMQDAALEGVEKSAPRTASPLTPHQAHEAVMRLQALAHLLVEGPSSGSLADGATDRAPRRGRAW